MKKQKEPKIRLKKIDLSKCAHKKDGACTNDLTIHPDISLKKNYLVLWDGIYAAGTFNMQWYGLNFNGIFDAGLQFDAPGTNSSAWEAVWEIIEL